MFGRSLPLSISLGPSERSKTPSQTKTELTRGLKERRAAHQAEHGGWIRLAGSLATVAPDFAAYRRLDTEEPGRGRLVTQLDQRHRRSYLAGGDGVSRARTTAKISGVQGLGASDLCRSSRGGDRGDREHNRDRRVDLLDTGMDRGGCRGCRRGRRRGRAAGRGYDT